MKKAIPVFLLLCLLMACERYGATEISGPVMIRSTRWGDGGTYSTIIMEYDNGYIKTLDRVCENTIPVWQGMRANISFSWKEPNSCFHIVSVQHIN